MATFAVVAFNQEKHIAQAIQGAFQQTYSPLEIILSDDCSSDETYEIMKEKAASYTGPHKVITRRNRANLGLAQHLNSVVAESRGEVIILAAGDDISKPERSKKLLDLFRENDRCFAVFSGFQPIANATIGTPKGTTPRNKIGLTELVLRRGGTAAGATYAYRRQCFLWPSSLQEWIIYEDRILPFRAALLGELIHFPEPLVYYRQPDELKKQVKKNRPGLDDRHWDMLHEHIESARRQKKIGGLRGALMNALCIYTAYLDRLTASPSAGWAQVLASFPKKILLLSISIRRHIKN